MIETYAGKTREEAIKNACEALGCSEGELIYEVTLEKKSLFSKRVEISAYCLNTVVEFVKGYITKVLTELDFTVSIEYTMEEGRMKFNIDTDNNSMLIGKNGTILRSIVSVVRAAVQHNFKERYEIDVDVNNYKSERYDKVAKMAKRFARQVQRTRVDMKLDPMPADERKVMHQVISNINYVRTESVGEGKNRYMTIIYDANKKVKKNVEASDE